MTMSLPISYDITIYQGDTYTQNFTLSQVSGGVENAVDLTGKTLLAQVRAKPEDEAILASFTVTVNDAQAGDFTIGLPSTSSKDLSRTSFYDIQTKDDVSGEVKTWIAGKISSPREVSRDYV